VGGRSGAEHSSPPVADRSLSQLERQVPPVSTESALGRHGTRRDARSAGVPRHPRARLEGNPLTARVRLQLDARPSWRYRRAAIRGQYELVHRGASTRRASGRDRETPGADGPRIRATRPRTSRALFAPPPRRGPTERNRVSGRPPPQCPTSAEGQVRPSAPRPGRCATSKSRCMYFTRPHQGRPHSRCRRCSSGSWLRYQTARRIEACVERARRPVDHRVVRTRGWPGGRSRGSLPVGRERSE
jgi:hypothetical protein